MKIYAILILLVALISIIVFAKYYFSRLGEAVNKEISNSYYYHARKDIVIYAPNGNWFELGYVELDADKDSFRPIAEEYGKDNKSIFWRGKKQEVDYATFSVDEDFIARDSIHVYGTTDDYGKPVMAVIEGADPKTYHLFDTGIESWNRYWHRDGAHYFYMNSMIDADYKTFRRINNTLALDTNSIYVIVHNTLGNLQAKDTQTVIKKHNNPQGEVKVLNNDYALIGSSLILSNWKTEFAIIPFPTVDTVTIIDDRNICINNQLVSDGKLYSEIDVASFKVIGRDYFKDKSHVYFDGQPIIDCDPETFEVVSEDYSKDSQHVFYKTQKLAMASPATFRYNYATDEGIDGKMKFKDGKLITKE